MMVPLLVTLTALATAADPSPTAPSTPSEVVPPSRTAPLELPTALPARRDAGSESASGRVAKRGFTCRTFSLIGEERARRHRRLA